MKPQYLHKRKLKPIYINVFLTVIVLVFTSCVSQQYRSGAKSEIFQTEANNAMIFANVDSVCGKAGALRFAQQTAAVRTLRQGYERFIVVNYSVESESKFESKSNFWGNIYTTTPVETGHRAEIEVRMLIRGDEGFDSGLDAKQVLGPTWREKVTYGIETCEY